jgi:hypothetical protein
MRTLFALAQIAITLTQHLLPLTNCFASGHVMTACSQLEYDFTEPDLFIVLWIDLFFQEKGNCLTTQSSHVILLLSFCCFMHDR